MDPDLLDQPSYRADWYRDPTGRFDFRYHNGQAWTGDVSVDGDRFLDPLPQPASGSAPAGFQAGPAVPFAPAAFASAPPARRASAGRATAAMVLGIGSVVLGWVPFFFVLGFAAGVLAIVFGLTTLRTMRRDPEALPHKSRNFALAGLSLGPVGIALCAVGVWLSVVSFKAIDEYSNIGDYDTSSTSCSVDDGVVTYSGTITNRSDDEHSYHVVVEFRRPDTDNVLANDAADVDDVDAGATATWTVISVIAYDDVDCRVGSVTGPLPFGQS